MVSGGGASEKFQAKWGGIPKMRREGGHANICTGLRGHSKFLRENLGRGYAIFLRDLKTTAPLSIKMNGPLATGYFFTSVPHLMQYFLVAAGSPSVH